MKQEGYSASITSLCAIEAMTTNKLAAVKLAILHLRYSDNEIANVLLDQANVLAHDLGNHERQAQIEQLRVQLG